MKNLGKLILGMTSVILISLTACQKEPIASFVMSKSEIVSGETVSFTNTSVDGSSFEWDFGDGSTSSDENPTHTFDKDGVYTIVMTATSKNGNKSSKADETLTVLHTTDLAITVYDIEDPSKTISECLLALFTNKTDWENGENMLVVDKTNSNGELSFTDLQAMEYYVIADKPLNDEGSIFYSNDETNYKTPVLKVNEVNTFKVYVEKYDYSNKKGTKAYKIVKIERASNPKTIVSK